MRPRMARTAMSPAYEDTRPNEAFRESNVIKLAENTLESDNNSPSRQYCRHSDVWSNPS